MAKMSSTKQLNLLLAALLPANVPAFLVKASVRKYLNEVHNHE